MDIGKNWSSWWSDCSRNASAGVIIGAVCGCVFGTADAGKSSGLTRELDMAKMAAKLRDKTTMQFFFRNQMLTTAQFGGFFGLYMTNKCLFLTQMDMDKTTGTALAAVVGATPFLASRVFRRNMIWAAALVGMDVYSAYSRELESGRGGPRASGR